MSIRKNAIAGLLLAVVVAPVQPVLAQSVNSGIVTRRDNPYAEEPNYNPYTQANLKLDVLEAQIETLRKKMQLLAHKKAYATKEWDEHYQKVKHQIDAWDKFQDEYGVK
jgi:vacuolar-type H+-ATPase subunit I/STV1